MYQVLEEDKSRIITYGMKLGSAVVTINANEDETKDRLPDWSSLSICRRCHMKQNCAV